MQMLPSMGYAMTAAANGRMSVPVSPSALIYSHFEHVSGVAAPEGTPGVSLNKLQILDALIDRLNMIRKDSASRPEETVSPERVESLIRSYEDRVRAAEKSAAVYPSLPSPEGALFSIAV
jgi:hypothetical protein